MEILDNKSSGDGMLMMVAVVVAAKNVMRKRKSIKCGWKCSFSIWESVGECNKWEVNAIWSFFILGLLLLTSLVYFQEKVIKKFYS